VCFEIKRPRYVVSGQQGKCADLGHGVEHLESGIAAALGGMEFILDAEKHFDDTQLAEMRVL
jgi:hypothetical protein